MPRHSAPSRSQSSQVPRAWHVLLVVAIVVSAYTTARCDRLAYGVWLGWVAIVPLFAAIRLLGPLSATGCGVLWGACVAMLHPVSLAELHSWSPLVMPLVAGAYTGLGSALTRWIGFSPFVLGVGWMGVELAAVPLGFSGGLASGGLHETAWMDLGGRALGFVVLAFVVAYVNAALLSLAGRMTTSKGRMFSARKSSALPAIRSPKWIRVMISGWCDARRPRAPPPGAFV